MSAPVRATRAAPLSRDRILEAAEALLREEGAGAFSMRRLAARLEVTPMAIYKWFASRDELLASLTERALDVAVPVSDPGASWSDRVVAVASALRTAMLEHRQLLRLVGVPQRLDGLMAVSSDRFLGLVRELGYEEVDAVEAYRILFWTVIDHCLVIDAGDAMPAVSGRYEAGRAVQSAVDSAGVEVPNIEALREWFGGVDRDEFFAQMVRTVAAGLEARAPARRT